MFKKKKKATKKNEDLVTKAPAAGAVELNDDVLGTAAGGFSVTSIPITRSGLAFCGKDGQWVANKRGTEAYVLRGKDGAFVGHFSSRAGAEAYAKEHGIE